MIDVPAKPRSGISAYEAVLRSRPLPLQVRHDLIRAHDLSKAVWTHCPAIESLMPLRGYVAGGFIRDWLAGRKPRDLDVFVWDASSRRVVEDRLRSNEWQLEECYPHMKTWRAPSGQIVQLIETGFRNPHDLLARFDLTICCAALDLSNMRAIVSEEFMRDVSARRLVIHNPAYPVETLRRVATFVGQGYEIPGEELMKLQELIASQISHAPPGNEPVDQDGWSERGSSKKRAVQETCRLPHTNHLPHLGETSRQEA